MPRGGSGPGGQRNISGDSLVQNRGLNGGTAHGTASMEATDITDRQERTAQGESILQAPCRTAVVERRRQNSPAACQGQHADRRHQRQAAATRCGHSQQGAARGHFAQARQPITVQPSNQVVRAALTLRTAGWQPDATGNDGREAHFSGFCPRHQRIGTRRHLTRSRRVHLADYLSSSRFRRRLAAPGSDLFK